MSVVQSTVEGQTVVTVDPTITPRSLTTDGPASDHVELTWLGQAGFAIRYAGRVHLVDPYLSDSLAAKYAGTVFPHERLHPAPVDPSELRGVSTVLHTHAHTDHLDPLTIDAVRQHNTPYFVAPRARRAIALDRNIPADRLIGIDAGETVQLDGLTVTAVPAAHEDLVRDADGAHHFLGYVVEVGGVRIYHSGDCVPYEGQADLLAGLAIDVALLPVNGRDAHRLANGVPGNFTLDEAVALCRAASIPALVCHHFGLFEFNTVGAEWLVARLTATAGGLQWTVPSIAAGFRLVPAHLHQPDGSHRVLH